MRRTAFRLIKPSARSWRTSLGSRWPGSKKPPPPGSPSVKRAPAVAAARREEHSHEAVAAAPAHGGQPDAARALSQHAALQDRRQGAEDGVGYVVAGDLAAGHGRAAGVEDRALRRGPHHRPE